MATLWERLYESGQLGGGRGQKRDGGVPRPRLEHTGRAFPDRDLRLNLWELFLQSRAKIIFICSKNFFSSFLRNLVRTETTFMAE